jgi:hypothetical protein
VGVADVAPTTYERFAGVCAIGAGVAVFLYSIAFIVLRSDLLSGLFLLLMGLLSSAALVAVYERLRPTEPSFALLGLLLAVIGALGAAVHGGYDLAVALHPPAATSADLPSQIDPRGLLTFGVSGGGLWMLAWLIVRDGALPRPLGYLGYLAAALAIVLYLGRLIVLTPSNPVILGPALVAGFLVNPIWYLWLGTVLIRGDQRR